MNFKVVLCMLLLAFLASASQIGKKTIFKQTLGQNASCIVINCKLCPVDNATCSECESTFYLLNNTCPLCSDTINNCNVCNNSNSSIDSPVCEACQTNFLPTNNRTKCEQCSTVISNCTTCNINSTCDLCNGDSYRNAFGANCTLCSSSISDCASCKADDSGANVVCQACSSLYLKNNTCVDCSTFVQNCTSCDFASQACTACAIGYYLANDGTECKSCGGTIPNCATCTPPAPNADPFCKSCNDQYLLENNTCTGCQQNFPPCLLCNTTNNTCITCQDKYYRAANGNGCQTCEGKDQNCISCHATDDSAQTVVCDVCKPGYFSNASNPDALCYLCNIAIDSCISCTGNAPDVNCTACNGFLVVDSTFKQCVTCSDVLSDCDGCTQDNTTFVVTCTHCANGKVLTDGQCKDSSASTIIIVSAIVGGVVLLGAGFAIFKCMKKRRSSPLAEEDYQKI